MADISAFDNIFDNFTKKSGFARKRRKIPLKRHKMAFKKHEIALKRHKIPLKRHKMALKRHKMSPDPDKTIVPGLCNYYTHLKQCDQLDSSPTVFK